MRKPINNRAFIDGQNLWLETTNANPSWTIDLKRFRVFLAEKYKVQRAYYFMGAYEPKNQDFYNALQTYGYVVVFREHASAALSHKKGNVDTDVVFEVMCELVDQEDFDKVVLVSGDGDYWRMVDYLIRKNKFEKLLVPNVAKLSSLYKNAPPIFIVPIWMRTQRKRKLAIKRNRNSLTKKQVRLRYLSVQCIPAW